MRTLLLVLALACLVACSSAPRQAPIVDASTTSDVNTTSRLYYTVSKGDTLYSVAFRYGTTYQMVAAANSIKPPYTIYPGQHLQIPAAGTTTSADAARPAVATTRNTQVHRSTVSEPRPASPVTGEGKGAAGIATASTVPASVPVTRSSSSNTEATVPAVNRGAWQWPTAGKVIDRFSTAGNVHKGIDIQGQLGQAVRAAKSGKVVYAGDGLKAYGLLVIVKHDDSFLSAYAYNRKIAVKEGDSVAAGQAIAEMGQRDDGRVLLHFEIRRDGNPQDPLRYLPPRN